MEAIDIRKFSNVSATTAAFPLQGGKYQVAISATFGGGNVGLQQLSIDGVTWLTAQTAFTAAGVANVELPPGQYRLAITTATAVFASICSIPNR